VAAVAEQLKCAEGVTLDRRDFTGGASSARHCLHAGTVTTATDAASLAIGSERVKDLVKDCFFMHGQSGALHRVAELAIP
jgi:hypothetical protein